MPLRATDCGLPVALSLIVKVAVLLPDDCGAKVTFTVHELAGATAEEQPDAEKSAAFAPATVIPCVKPRGALPVFAIDMVRETPLPPAG